MALDSENSTSIDSTVLDSTNIRYDKVFEEVVKAISPKKIVEGNQEILEAFVDILAEVSPTSVNILDVFSKDTSNPNIANVQENFAKMYLNNFYYVWQKAESDYVLRNRLENLLQQYKSLNNNEVFSDLIFFGDEESMYTTERYILGKDFKEKKGTASAVEYAYRVGWLAGIEGPLRTNYDFTLIQEECAAAATQGFMICDSTTIACTDGETSTPGSLINTFIIDETVTDVSCNPFTYKVEGSMLPELFEAFVIPLAHPVGFRYIYSKVLKMSMEDYFNLEYIYSADEVNVYSLCPDGDCTQFKITQIATEDNLGLSKSSLKLIEEGKIYTGEFKDYTYQNYIFENGDNLIQYSLPSAETGVERVIRYYDISELLSTNIISNPEFETSSYWNIADNSEWYIDSVSESARLENGLIGDFISQPIALIPDRIYSISVSVSDITGIGQLSLGKWQKYDDNGDILVGQFDEWIYTFDTGANFTYTFQYTARGNEHFQISAQTNNTSFNIDSVIMYEDIPTLEFPTYSHSSIELVNLGVPVPVLYTYDELESFDFETNIQDDMNTLYYDYNGDLTAIIGVNIVIGNYYYGESTYETTSLDQEVTISISETVDYTTVGLGSGVVGTIYRALGSHGFLNINTEDFTNTLRWEVYILNNVRSDSNIGDNNEGTFIIGSDTIPLGDPNTAYISENFVAEIEGLAWIDTFIDDDFIDTTKWNTGSEVNIEIGATPDLNKAVKLVTVGALEADRTLTRINDYFPESDAFLHVTLEIYVLEETVNYTDTWVDFYIGNGVAHRYYSSGLKEIMMPYDGNMEYKFIFSDGFEGSINNINVKSSSIYDGLIDGNILYADGNAIVADGN